MADEYDPELEADLEALSRAKIFDLRERYRALFKSEPPRAFGPDLLRRSIAQRLQEKRYGGLSAATRRELRRLVEAFEKNPRNRIEVPRRIAAGAVLTREWKGAHHRVMTLKDGYSYHGRTYTNLSEIAREITGTRWNGPRFFGLRKSTHKEPNREQPHSLDPNRTSHQSLSSGVDVN